MKIIKSQSINDKPTSPLGSPTPRDIKSPLSGKSIDEPYKFIDRNGKLRGTVMLSSFEAEVMQSVLSKGDLMTSHFRIIK